MIITNNPKHGLLGHFELDDEKWWMENEIEKKNKMSKK